MKISYNWLMQYCKLDVSPARVAELLTGCGLEVESMSVFESVRGGLKGVVTGEVKTKEKHPNADRLSLTTVDIGTPELLQIVCGAPNVEAGQKVLVATAGTMLYPLKGDPFEIKKSKIRGEVSEGMICAEDELGLGESHDGIMVLDSSVPAGIPAGDYFKIETDTVYEIGLTPNRVDAASHIGVARDLLAIVNVLKNENHSLVFPSAELSRAEKKHPKIEVVVEDTAACPRYAGVSVSGITVSESPSWLKNKLLAVGLKPVNNVVDVTNFVLYECGQPLHAFDADRIAGNKIIVKKLPAGTKFTTLDGVERTLSADDLMICNVLEGMVIAGVFGGLDAGVKNGTKNIFIESAYFSPSGIRKTSNLHGLKTDAAFRYERGADPSAVIPALKRAAAMICEIAGGTVSSDITDICPRPAEPATVNFRFSRLESLSGAGIEKNKVRNILTSLGIKIREDRGDTLLLEVPTAKVDVTREVDVIEEVLRIYGLDKIPLPSALRSFPPATPKPDREKIINTFSSYLSASGFFEIMSNSLTSSAYAGNGESGMIPLLNPSSADLDSLRVSMLYSGLQAVAYNKNRQRPDLKLYEYGKTYSKKGDAYIEKEHLSLLLCGKSSPEHWNTPAKETDFYLLKSNVHYLLQVAGNPACSVKEYEGNLFSAGLSYAENGNTLVSFGRVEKNILKKFDIAGDVYYADFDLGHLLRLAGNRNVRYEPLPRFPEVRRDLALLIDRGVTFDEIERLAGETERTLLKSINLFDVYAGEKIPTGKKSYAVSFILQDNERTLTDKQIEKTMQNLSDAFEQKLGAAIRKE